MTAVKARDVERALRRVDSHVLVLLLYGPDTGMVAERARAVAENAVTDASDPFQLVRMEGDILAADPGRLADEVGTIPLFGGRRAIWVRPTSRNIAPAVEAVLGSEGRGTVVVVEAGDLGRTAPLRTCCERSPRALALPCYADTSADVGALLDDSFRDARMRLDPDARATLLSSLGADRLATRREVEKLILYARGQSTVTLADVDAVVSNVSGLALDGIVDAAFCGEGGRVDELFGRAREGAISPSTVLGHALRHALALFAVQSEAAAIGKPARAMVDGWRGLHFSRKDAVTRQLGIWTGSRLRPLLDEIQQGVLAVRRAPEVSDAVASGLLLGIARKARFSRGRSPTP